MQLLVLLVYDDDFILTNQRAEPSAVLQARQQSLTVMDLVAIEFGKVRSQSVVSYFANLHA